MGFNSFLGLTPEEQHSDMARQRIFEFHENVANPFIVGGVNTPDTALVG